MRILQINSAKNFGGGEKHLVDLTRGLLGRGQEIFLAVSPASPIAEKLPEIASENILELKIKNAVDVFAAAKIARFVAENNIEIVHAHTGKDYLPASLALRFSKKVKLVITRHVMFPLKIGQKFLLSNVSRAIAVSSAVEESLRKTFPADKIATIPNGINLENWSPADREEKGKNFRFENNIAFDQTVLTAIGELKELKGQRDLILAAQIIVERCPETHFIIVGKDNSADREFRKEIKRLAKVFDLEKKFTWLNWVDDTRELLAATDIFVSPSQSESFGLAMLESMASGCAVLATATDGAKELLVDGESGILTPINEPKSLADKACALIGKPEKIKSLANAARIRAVENFGLERMIDETENLYLNL